MKSFIVGSGWKMELSYSQSIRAAIELDEKLKGFHDFPVVIFPAFTALAAIHQCISPESCVKLGGQDVFWEESGSYTGEVSAQMLLDVGCEYVEINHQERRTFLRETDEMSNKKLKMALSDGLKPFLCIGEEKKGADEETRKYIKSQMLLLLKNISCTDVKEIIFAYEPRWAIGNYGKISFAHIEKSHGLIRSVIGSLYGTDVAHDVKIIYGGGITMDSYARIAELQNVNGLFTTKCGINPSLYSEIAVTSAKLLSRGI